MSHHSFFQYHDWPWILVTDIMNFTYISLLVSATAASVQGMLRNFILKWYFCELQKSSLHLCDRLVKS